MHTRTNIRNSIRCSLETGINFRVGTRQLDWHVFLAQSGKNARTLNRVSDAKIRGTRVEEKEVRYETLYQVLKLRFQRASEHFKTK